MARRKRVKAVTAAQSKLWPRIHRSNEERALRYNNLRAFGFNRLDAIRLRDVSDKQYFGIVDRLSRPWQRAG